MPPKTRATSAASRAGPRGSQAQRPAIPVQQSFAYGSPGRVTLPARLDRTIHRKSAAQAIDEALARSGQVPRRQQNDEKEEKEKEEEEEGEGEEGGGEGEEEEVEEEEEEEEEEEDQPQGPPTDPHGSSSEPSDSDGEPSYSRPYSLRARFNDSKSDPDDADRASVLSFRTESYLAGNANLGPLPRGGRPSRPNPRRRTSRKSFFGRWLEFLWGDGDQLSLLDMVNGLAIMLVFVYFTWNMIKAGIPRLGKTIQPIGEWWPWGSGYPPATHAGEIDAAALSILRSQSYAQYKQVRDRLDSLESTISKVSSGKEASLEPHTPIVRRINFFARRSGAEIDPHLTSPTRRRFKLSWKQWVQVKIRGSLPPPWEQGPEAIFQKWDDVGDCWCSPEAGGKSQIAIISPFKVIPKEIVVEHISEDSSLEPGAAPKQIELYVKIEDPRKRELVANAAITMVKPIPYDQKDDGWKTEEVLKNEFGVDHALDHTWVRIGRWQYEIHLDMAAQIFPIPINLENYQVPVTNFVVRSMTNWGATGFVCLYRLKLYGLKARIKNSTDEKPWSG
ncbi:MAG: zinc finger and BTB [Stictis urceolatum]|nr:zinc finger and BTB [Stictis urceolata]